MTRFRIKNIPSSARIELCEHCRLAVRYSVEKIFTDNTHEELAVRHMMIAFLTLQRNQQLFIMPRRFQVMFWGWVFCPCHARHTISSHFISLRQKTKRRTKCSKAKHVKNAKSPPSGCSSLENPGRRRTQAAKGKKTEKKSSKLRLKKNSAQATRQVTRTSL